MPRNALSLAVALAALGQLPLAPAVQVCELNGQHVNPSNGSTTEGKTGLMRCREGGPVTSELEERGNVVRDDEVFEDGSRKAVGR